MNSHGQSKTHVNKSGTLPTLFYLGELAPTRVYPDQGIALDDPTWDRSAVVRLSSQIQGVTCWRYAAWTLWYLGYPAQALQRSHEAIALAQGLTHPYSVAYALYNAAVLPGLRREAQAAQERAEAVIALARQQELPGMVARGTVPRGWSLAMQGQRSEGIAQMRQGMDAQRTMGAEVQRPYRLAMLAEIYGQIGQTAEALPLLAEALALTHHYGGHFYEAEVDRLTDELLLMQDVSSGILEGPPPDLSMIDGHEGEATGPSPRHTEADTWFRQALAVARRQQAKSLELRAAMSFSRLWQQQDQRTDAYQLLAPIYGWFTEGFDTADLQDAKALLDVLACHE